MIISVNAENTLNKIQHLSWLKQNKTKKNLKDLGIEGNYFKLQKNHS